MAETYYLQRKHIHNHKDLSKFLEDWPYFSHHKVIMAHANELLGKDTVKTWKESLNQLTKPINCFSRNYETVACEKWRKKNKDKGIPPELTHVRKQIKTAKEYSNLLKNKELYQNIIFDFIAKFMGEKEKIKFFYVLIGVSL